MEKLQLSEIAAAVGSETPLEAAVNDICTDTRKLEPGCLFLALRGANFDGHQFVKKAIADGRLSVYRCAGYRNGIAANCSILPEEVLADSGWRNRQRWKDNYKGNDCTGAFRSI